MRVFISHKSEDVELAKHYAEELKKLGFDYYLDEYDIHIKNSSDRGSLINNEIKKSTDLLVIVTENTKKSWWVPFEIGLSTAANNRIVTIMHDGASELPSFLRKWPVIDTDKKYQTYISELKKNNRKLLLESKQVSKSMEGILHFSNNAELFHSNLINQFSRL